MGLLYESSDLTLDLLPLLVLDERSDFHELLECLHADFGEGEVVLRLSAVLLITVGCARHCLAADLLYELDDLGGIGLDDQLAP